MTFSVETVADLDPEKVDHFLRRCFSAKKCDFLRDHGAWRHRGNENRFGVLENRSIVGYFASIPTEVLVDGEAVQARWWMDLFVPPDQRGRGIQRVTDEAAKSLPGLHLGFPNHVAAVIHRRHGWGVREDLAVMMMPLRPPAIAQVRQARGVKGTVLRGAAVLVSPVASLARGWLSRLSTDVKEMHNAPAWGEMLDSLRRGIPAGVVTNRCTEAWLRWRFSEYPQREELRYFVIQTGEGQSLVAVTRVSLRSGEPHVRILSVFGDAGSPKARQELLLAVARDAAKRGAAAVTILAGDKRLQASLRGCGFLLQTSARLRWWSSDRDLMNSVSEGSPMFSLADSDNDTVE